MLFPNEITEEEEYRPSNSSKLYEYDSDDSLNLYEQESFQVPSFQPMLNFGCYRSNEYLISSPHLNTRRHSSYSHEDIMNMKNQHIPIDPRYRDSRPFIKSSSNIYDNARRDFMSRRRSSSSLQDGVLNPFQLIQMNEFLRRSSPTMGNRARSRSSSPNVSDKSNSNSNWNLNPSILIEEYNDNNQVEVKSNNSSTNLSFNDIRQPLNEDSVAPFAGCDEIPFIDDDNILVSTHYHICDNNIPEINCISCSDSSNQSTYDLSQSPIKQQQEQHQTKHDPKNKQQQQQIESLRSRKTVSFDMDGSDDVLNNKSTHYSENITNIDQSNLYDHIKNVMLNRYGIDSGTKTDYYNDKSNAANEPIQQNEPIFKFCTYKRTNTNNSINNTTNKSTHNETKSFKNIPSIDYDNYSAYFYENDSDNGQILANNNLKTIDLQNINENSIASSNRKPPIIDTKAITLDLSELHSSSTNSSSLTTTTTQLTQQNVESPRSGANDSDHNNAITSNDTNENNDKTNKFAYIIVPDKTKTMPCALSNSDAITGKVKTLRNFFEQMKMPSERLSFSTPNLTKECNDKLSASEQKSVLDQLKIWSKTGSIDNNNRNVTSSIPKKQQNFITNPSTHSLLNVCVRFDDDDYISNIQLTESERSISDSNIEIHVNPINEHEQRKKRFSESYIHQRGGGGGDNISIKSNPNLHEIKSALKINNSTFNSKIKAKIYNSPCHRSTYLTLRKIKQNRKLAKSGGGCNSTTSGSVTKSTINTNDGDETR